MEEQIKELQEQNDRLRKDLDFFMMLFTRVRDTLTNAGYYPHFSYENLQSLITAIDDIVRPL
jgi:hypothetical protein